MRAFLLFIAAFGLAGSALGDGFSYSLLEGGYVRTDIDRDVFGVDVVGDGFSVAGSLAATENFHVFGAFADQDFDFDFGLQTFSVGAGLNWPLHSDLDIIGRVSYVKTEIDGPFGISISDDGFGASAGLRGRVLQRAELEGAVAYVKLDGGGSNTAPNFAARIFLTDMFALGAAVTFDDEVTTWGINARLNFGSERR
jgi:hypothetical protein